MSLCGVCHMCAPCMQDKYRIVFNMQDKNVKKLVNVVDKQHNYIAINFPKDAYQHYYCLVCFVLYGYERNFNKRYAETALKPDFSML